MAVRLPLLQGGDHYPGPGAAADPATGAVRYLDHEWAAKVMAAMDEASRRWSRATVVPAATMGGSARGRTFTTKFEMRSPRFTTRWDELPVTR